MSWPGKGGEVRPGLSVYLASSPNNLKEKAFSQFNKKDDVYLFDGYCGSNPKSQKKIRFIHELAWQQHFVKNMFIDTENQTNMENFNPDFTIMNACS